MYPRIFLRRYPIFCRNSEVVPQQHTGIWLVPVWASPIKYRVNHGKKPSPLLNVEKCSIKGSLRSFSYGVHTQTVKATKWEATVYTDDPAVFEAHLLHQFKLAREIIEGKFTFFSVQDRIMTPFARRVLGEMLLLKEANFLKDETMRVYERPFNR